MFYNISFLPDFTVKRRPKLKIAPFWQKFPIFGGMYLSKYYTYRAGVGIKLLKIKLSFKTLLESFIKLIYYIEYLVNKP